MKKYIAFLLCLIMMISLVSCNRNNINEKENNHSTSNTTSETPSENTDKECIADYSRILNIYRSIIEILPDFFDSKTALDDYCSELGIVDEEEKELFKKIFGSTFDFKGSPPYKLSCGFAIKDLNGDGVDELVLLNNEYYIIAVFSYADGKPVLLGNYMTRGSCWIDGDGLLHENGSNGADHSTHAVYRIADGTADLELIVGFGTNGHEWIGDIAYTKYYKLVNGEKEKITETEYNDLNKQYCKYLGSVSGPAATKKYSGLEFVYLFTESEIAMEMYEAAINDKVGVFDEHLGETKLKSLRFTDNDTRLDECKLLQKAILDVDQNGVNEYVIKSPDNEYIILRYYNGKVYSYWLDTYDFYNFNTDGSFHWYDSSESEGWECGLSKIVFDEERLNQKSIYCLKYSKNPTKYEHFVGGEAVTGNEYDSYRNNIRYERIKFSQFELTCTYPITAEQAWNLANAYWDHQDGKSECSAGTIWTAKIVLTDTPNTETDHYRFAFQVECSSNGGMDGYECMPPHHFNVHDHVLVNAFTGEVIASTYDPNGKGVSVEEAIEIAKKHCEIHKEENGYRFEYAHDATAPDHIYVIVTKNYYNDHYSVVCRTWIDKNTGEIVSPYYMYGKC